MVISGKGAQKRSTGGSPGFLVAFKKACLTLIASGNGSAVRKVTVALVA